jgi:carbonic anhydrase/acetyltransferase-like protein (isoleucine patch superfamily)
MNEFMYDFGQGEVLAKRHPNGGGIVAKTAKVSNDSFVGSDAVVYDSAIVMNQSSIEGNARIHGNAFVANGAKIKNDVEIFGSAEVNAPIVIFGNSKISITPKIVLGFDHPVIITDDHILMGCHSFTHEEWKEKALAIIRVNGYPSKTARQIHKFTTDLMSIHLNLFSHENMDEYFKSE